MFSIHPSWNAFILSIHTSLPVLWFDEPAGRTDDGHIWYENSGASEDEMVAKS